MPECPKCHEYYFGSPEKCPKCNYLIKQGNPTLPYEPNSNRSTPSYATSGASGNLDPDARSSWQAERLDKWGRIFLFLCIAVAIILFIASGFQPRISPLADISYEFSFGAMFSVGSIVNALLWIGGGFAFKLLLNSFAVIVEASYRSMKKQ